MSFKPRYISAFCTNEAIPAPPPRILLLQPAALWARTEQSGPEANHRRPGAHGLLQISRHAHGELFEPELVAKTSDELESGPGHGLVPDGGHRHEPVDATAEIPQARHDVVHLRRGATAPFLRAGRVNLHQQGRQFEDAVS